MGDVIEVNTETGEVKTRPITPEEQATLDTVAAQSSTVALKRQRQITFLQQVKSAALTPTVVQKIKDGTALTALETQLMLRWLATDAALDDLTT